jgi:hypothetical protein
MSIDHGSNHLHEVKRNFEAPMKNVITIEGVDSKNRDSRNILINSTLTEELNQIKIKGSILVFPSPHGGWKSLSMVQRYAHLSQEHERKAVEQLESIIKVENKWKNKDIQITTAL